MPYLKTSSSMSYVIFLTFGQRNRYQDNRRESIFLAIAISLTSIHHSGVDSEETAQLDAFRSLIISLPLLLVIGNGLFDVRKRLLASKDNHDTVKTQGAAQAPSQPVSYVPSAAGANTQSTTPIV